MQILIDSREQRELEFSHPYITGTERVTLKVGDYCCEYTDGFRPPVIFERKSIGDLFGTLGKGHKRFKREIEKSNVLSVKLILIIEGSFTHLLKGYKHSRLQGITVIRKLFTLWIKYGLCFVLVKDRKEMSQYITEYYCSIGRIKGKRKT